MKTLIQGKVRDVYELCPDTLMIVTSDRLSAFDVILPTPIPGKGAVLNRLSLFWFDFTKDIVPNHILPPGRKELPPGFEGKEYEGRTVLCKKLRMLPYEFIVRGYMFGSMWKEYRESGSFCGQAFSRNYIQAEKLEQPLLTPSAKNETGHDENISLERLYEGLGKDRADKIAYICRRLYERCYQYALGKGIIIADTKFEFGLDENDEIVLADEIFTPDSSRFWDAAAYTPGSSPKSYDKQFVRDWLTERGLDGVTPPPEIPADIVEKTQALYRECLERLTGQEL